MKIIFILYLITSCPILKASNTELARITVDIYKNNGILNKKLLLNNKILCDDYNQAAKILKLELIRCNNRIITKTKKEIKIPTMDEIIQDEIIQNKIKYLNQ